MTAISLRYSLLSVVAAGAVASLPILGVIAIRSSSCVDTEALAQVAPAADAPAIVEAYTPEARIEPAIVDGHITGFRLSHVARDSFYAQLGLKNGDIVTAIDGLVLAGPEDALVIYEQLKGERTIAVDIIREGQRGTLHHSIH